MKKTAIAGLGEPDSVSDLGRVAIRAVVEARPKDGMPELNVVGSTDDSDDVIWRSPVWGIDVATPADPWDAELVGQRVDVLLGRFVASLREALINHLEVG